MLGKAQILTRTKTVAAECPVKIDFPPIPIPELPELNARFTELKNESEQLSALTEDPVQRLSLRGLGKKLALKIEKLLDEQEPDRQELNRALFEFDRIVNPPPDDMDPPRAQFRQIAEDCRDLLASKGPDADNLPFFNMLNKIENDGNDAYTTKNQKKWKTANENLAHLNHRIQKVGSDNGETELPPTTIMKDHAKLQVDGLCNELNVEREKLEHRGDFGTKFKPRCNEVEKLLDTMKSDIDKIDDDLEPKRGLAIIKHTMRFFDRLKRKIQTLGQDIM